MRWTEVPILMPRALQTLNMSVLLHVESYGAGKSMSTGVAQRHPLAHKRSQHPPWHIVRRRVRTFVFASFFVWLLCPMQYELLYDRGSCFAVQWRARSGDCTIGCFSNCEHQTSHASCPVRKEKSLDFAPRVPWMWTFCMGASMISRSTWLRKSPRDTCEPQTTRQTWPVLCAVLATSVWFVQNMPLHDVLSWTQNTEY